VERRLKSLATITDHVCDQCGAVAATIEETSHGYTLLCARCGASHGGPSASVIKFLEDTVRVFGTPHEPVIINRAMKDLQMNRNQLFPSKYFAAADLTKPLNVVIEGSSVEKLNDPNGGVDEKLVLRFTKQKKRLVVNKTNYNSIADLHGDETEDWGGKSIQLYADTTNVGAKRVACVRVRATSVAEQLNDAVPL
jgi:hypothetical protein